MDIRKQFGSNVRKFRLVKNWTQDHLAEAAGLDRTYISGIERGRRNPTLLVVQQIALALGVPESDLLRNYNA
jgi:transcriptional regulator with XRE-family HTH domain